MNNADKIKNELSKVINKLALDGREFLYDQTNDFTRKRKLDLKTVLKFMICMETGSIKDELYKHFGLGTDNPTASAFIQQRKKVKVGAFKWMFEEFNQVTMDRSYRTKLKGYRLVAIDGSSLNISHNPKDLDTYLSRTNIMKESLKGYNAFHLTASYDLLEHTYVDLIIQGEARMNENGAFNELVDRYNGDTAIFIADRGFESYNSFVHVMESKNKFLIRVKDINSKTSLLKGLRVQETGDFDIDIERILTPRQTKEIIGNPDKYKMLGANMTFDYFKDKHSTYDLKCRVVRFQISDNTYEAIVTNLDRDEFSSDEIKKLYNLRWGIETSFRELKYAVGLSAFHAKNRDFIKQEIYARVLFYNLAQRIMRKVIPNKTNSKKHYTYQINFTRAFHNIYAFLKIKDGIKPPDIESIIAKELEPVRSGRSDPRKIRRQGAVFFTYRFI